MFTACNFSSMTSLQPQAPVNFPGGVVNGSVSSCSFTYKDGSGSPATFVVPSANCSGGMCEQVFNIPNSSVPLFYTVSVTATNVIGEGPANTSQPIREQLNIRLHVQYCSARESYALHDKWS